VTRVIAGAARGRRLAVPPGTHTRPTSDRAREGLFSTLESLRRSLRGARVLDLYAGSGAVGIEALSRGAAKALFVESDKRTVAVLRANVAATRLAGGSIAAMPVERLLGQAAYGARYDPPYDPPYDIVFLDPPYIVSDSTVAAALTAGLVNGWIAGDGIVVVERATRGGEFSWPTGFVADRSRRYGEATLWYGRALQADAETDAGADDRARVGVQPPERGD
jgi:16S rRNA (guanine966-N2)-methyltransferase